jgi:hypothetical protein
MVCALVLHATQGDTVQLSMDQRNQALEGCFVSPSPSQQ